MSKNKQIHKKQLKKIINKSIENSDFMFTSAKSLTDWYYYEKYIENNLHNNIFSLLPKKEYQNLKKQYEKNKHANVYNGLKRKNNHTKFDELSTRSKKAKFNKIKKEIDSSVNPYKHFSTPHNLTVNHDFTWCDFFFLSKKYENVFYNATISCLAQDLFEENFYSNNEKINFDNINGYIHIDKSYLNGYGLVIVVADKATVTTEYIDNLIEQFWENNELEIENGNTKIVGSLNDYDFTKDLCGFDIKVKINNMEEYIDYNIKKVKNSPNKTLNDNEEVEFSYLFNKIINHYSVLNSKYHNLELLTYFLNEYSKTQIEYNEDKFKENINFLYYFLNKIFHPKNRKLKSIFNEKSKLNEVLKLLNEHKIDISLTDSLKWHKKTFYENKMSDLKETSDFKSNLDNIIKCDVSLFIYTLLNNEVYVPEKNKEFYLSFVRFVNNRVKQIINDVHNEYNDKLFKNDYDYQFSFIDNTDEYEKKIIEELTREFFNKFIALIFIKNLTSEVKDEIILNKLKLESQNNINKLIKLFKENSELTIHEFNEFNKKEQV